MIHVKRVYELWSEADGTRILVDRLWPRGLSKRQAHVDRWLREVAPSPELRTWFGHDPARWEEFRRRYYAELDGKRTIWQSLEETARQGTVTLLYSASDTAHNNAVALKDYVEAKGKE